MNGRDESILKHIAGYCDKLLSFTSGMTYSEFRENELCKDACALNILQIGELVGLLSDEFREGHPSMPWRQIKAMRNIVAHHYGAVDAETVWETISDDIPVLKKFCEETGN